MLNSIAYAEGSPSPTLVVDATSLPETEDEIGRLLYRLQSRLNKSRLQTILKYALIQRSAHPMFDLDYRFAQMVPGVRPLFDFHCNCGHSALASITVANAWGWLPRLSPGSRVRVYTRNNGDNIVCEVDEISRDSVAYTVHFIQPTHTKLGALLLTGEPLTVLKTSVGDIETSIVSVGNPYVFVDAAALRVSSSEQLFTAGDDLLIQLQLIRKAAAHHLGWNENGVLPKIAAIGAFEKERLAARAISVPSWHPDLALTGTVCISAAAAIDTSIVGSLTRRVGCVPDRLRIDTPKGSTTVACTTTGDRLDSLISHISVSNKWVRLIGPM